VLASPTITQIPEERKAMSHLARAATVSAAAAVAPVQVIVQYILDKWFGVGPSLIPKTPETKALASLATRIHDMYITTIQVRDRDHTL
jgi:hypothetical protein